VTAVPAAVALTEYALKPLVGRSINGYPSFPSGHAMLSFVVFGMLAYLLWRHFPKPLIRAITFAVAALLILGIGVSRVYLGVHYPSDIIAEFPAATATDAVRAIASYIAQHRTDDGPFDIVLAGDTPGA